MMAYLSIQECAAEVRVSPWTIWKACRLGILSSIRVGTKPDTGVYRIAPADWTEFKSRALVRPPRPKVVDPRGGLLIDEVLRGAR